MHGVPVGTKDIDFLARQTAENYERLAKAMLELKAKYRGVEDLEVPWSGPLLSSQIFGNFTCGYGDFDVIKEIPGGLDGSTVGYEDLIEASNEYTTRGMTIRVASLDDVIASKRAANRPKDLETLPILEEFLKKQKSDQFGKSSSPTLDNDSL